MKKLFLFLLMSVTLVVAAAPPLLAQSPMDPIKDFLSQNLEQYFVTLAVYAPFIVVITGWVNRVLDARKGAAQVISWVVALATGFLASWLNLGIFADLSLLLTIATAGAGGLVANGIYDIALVQEILKIIKAIVPES